MKLLTTPLQVAVHYDHINPVFGEETTHVALDDEAAGPFITISQDDKTLKFDIEELEVCLRVAKDLLKTYPKETE